MHKNNLDLSGKTAVVTGSSRGIGKNIADLFASQGCEVFYTGTSEKGPSKDKYMQLDLSSDKSIERFIMGLERIPKIDILVNNAGINIIEPIYELNAENFEKIIKVNLTGCARMIKEVSQKMIKAKTKGRILNVSSIFGVISKEKRNSYSASKTGLIGLTRSCSLDLAEYGILVNAICPGFTNTDLTSSILLEKEKQLLCFQIPAGRFAEPDEIAKTALFLVSDANSYMTGQILVADGGFTVQ